MQTKLQGWQTDVRHAGGLPQNCCRYFETKSTLILSAIDWWTIGILCGSREINQIGQQTVQWRGVAIFILERKRTGVMPIVDRVFSMAVLYEAFLLDRANNLN